jgi:hypothetical protein
VTPFWYAIVTLCVIAAIVNFIFAYARRKRPMMALVRGGAAAVSLVLAVGIILGKAISIDHPYLDAQYVFIAVGIFIAVVFLLPSYIEKVNGEGPKVSMQQRAARPVKATVRLRDVQSDEWVN